MQSNATSTQKLRINPQFGRLILLAAIVVMLLIWKPWSTTSSRTVMVTGSTTITATPDEFIFYPSYQFENTSKDIALSELAAKSESLIARLKSLGVANDRIKTNSSGYQYPLYSASNDGKLTYNLQLTITVSDQKLAQKVQDYLVTTGPTGTISPQANFSDAKREVLEKQARTKAIQNARSKVEQMASNLHFKIGNVKSISDSNGFGGIIPFEQGRAVATDVKSETSLALQPGKNELHYTMTVTYFIR